MGNKNEKEFYLGLDIGTNSVGYAVTDQDYNLIRKRGKHLWGVRIFPDAQPASGRRVFRVARRRLARRRYRLLVLRDLFSEEILRLDPTFFQRLDFSYVYKDDKEPLIFQSKKEEKAYFKKYPTIYHLRKALVTESHKFDIRLIYLAFAHMTKYRGNFLLDGKIDNVGNDVNDLKTLFDSLDEALSVCSSQDLDSELEGETINFGFDLKKISSILVIFKSEKNTSQRFDDLKNVLEGDDLSTSKRAIAILKSINGNTTKVGQIFPRFEENEEYRKKEINFEADDFDAQFEEMDLTDEEKEVLNRLKSIYDYRVLAHLLKGKKFISEAMVEIYETHKSDLALLKKALKLLPIDEANDILNATGANDHSYARYVGVNIDRSIKKKDRMVRVSRFSEAEKGKFLSKIKSALKLDLLKKEESFVLNERLIEPGDANWRLLCQLESRVNGESFLPKQNNKNNGVFPYQLNEIEMREIIERQGVYYPFLKEKAKGYPNPKEQEYKAISLLRYRIPYYVGPITREEGPNHWAQFKEGSEKLGRITPWNFFDVIDDRKSGQKFIDGLKNDCSYIYGEPTLPKFSLVYQYYQVLNDLNNLKLNGSPIEKKDKDYLISEVYLKERNVTPQKLVKAIARRDGVPEKDVRLTSKSAGGEEGSAYVIKANLSTFIDLDPVFGTAAPSFLSDMGKWTDPEKAVYLITVFEDRQSRYNALKNEGLVAQEDQLKKLSNLRYKGWGRLSRKLLCGIYRSDDDTGEVFAGSPNTILGMMASTSRNFMEIYEDESLGFKKTVEDLNSNSGLDEEELLESVGASPAMKRSYRQSLKIVRELLQILHIDHFDKIFVETTRAKSEKKPTKSRDKKIEEYLSAAKGVVEEAYLDGLDKELESKKNDLRSKHLFLYFMQLGRDVYTGEKIDLENINEYDIDHIIPQALLKDDSFKNTVLVKSELNRNKSDVYPLPQGTITPKGRAWIETLNKISVGPNKEHPLMPNEKRERILRVNPLKDEETIGFVNRQLVLTNQSVKATIEILKSNYPETEVVYAKAGHVSDFREAFDLVKCRDLNNYHHAHDAYLNIVVGNVYDQYFTSRLTQKWLEDRRAENHSFTLKTGAINIFAHDRYRRDRKGLTWNAGNPDETLLRVGGTIDTIRKTMSWNDPLMSHMTYTWGGFFNKVTILPKGSNADFKIKQTGEYGREDSAEIYGGYKDLTRGYFSLVKSKQGKRTIYTLEAIPTVRINQGRNQREQLERYLSKDLKGPEIILEKVLIRTVLEIPKEKNQKAGYIKLAISGASDKRVVCINVSEPKLPSEQVRYLRALSKILGTNLPAGEKVNLEKYWALGSNDSITVKDRKGSVRLNQTNNLIFMNAVMDLSKDPKYGCLNSFDSLNEKSETFLENLKSIPLIKQIQVIHDYYSLLSCKPVRFDFESVKMPRAVGQLRISKTLAPGTKLLLVSPTGYYQKVLFVVPEE